MGEVGAGGDVGAVLFPDDAPEVDKIDTILGEIESTIAEMRMLEKKLGGEATDSSDKIAFYRAKTALIERWANTKERIYNLKEMSEFQSSILAVMDEVLTVDQRADLVERLRNFRSIKVKNPSI